MKKIKLFLCVALFGAMSFGAFTAYDYVTMSADEKFLLANIEALTRKEPGGGDAPSCAAGGCNATSCNFSGQIEVLGNGVSYTNGITCQDAWACCFTTAYCFSKSKC